MADVDQSASSSRCWSFAVPEDVVPALAMYLLQHRVRIRWRGSTRSVSQQYEAMRSRYQRSVASLGLGRLPPTLEEAA